MASREPLVNANAAYTRFEDDPAPEEEFRPPPFAQSKRSGREDYELPLVTPGRSSERPKSTLTPAQQRQVELDAFLVRVYEYFVGKGIYCILLARLFDILTIFFSLGFALFLLMFIDYDVLLTQYKLWEAIRKPDPAKMHPFVVISIIMSAIYFTWETVKTLIQIPKLVEMYRFYNETLQIPDRDMQTIPWSHVLQGLRAARTTHPVLSGAKLTAIEVASRIMRKDNYLIALFNKDYIDLSLPMPSYFSTGKRHFLTKVLEWSLRYALIGYVFDGNMVKEPFLKNTNRAALVSGLRKRFLYVGLINFVMAPFMFAFLAIYVVFRYGYEIRHDPRTVGLRQYTEWALWKYRDFNELPHLFQQRINSSYPKAERYINQYPQEKLATVARFITFVAGALAFALAVLSIVDEDVLIKLEISPGRSVIWYLGVFAAIVAGSRGLVPDERAKGSYSPKELLIKWAEDTHYMPEEWENKLHTDDIRHKLAQMFEYRIVLDIFEVLSVLIAPIVLWFTLPGCAEQIVEFFHEFSVDVAGTGVVCTFSEFNFTRNGNTKFGAPSNEPGEYYSSRGGKMEQSFLNFKAHNPDWHPEEEGARQYLEQLNARGMEASVTSADGYVGDRVVTFLRKVKQDKEASDSVMKASSHSAGT